MLKLSNISKKYGDQSVLNHFNIEISKNNWAMIIGESGAGKSTLLKIIANELSFDGEIETNHSFISISHQENDLLNELTVYENCVCNMSSNISSDQLNNLFKYSDLDKILDQAVETLSGGQKQRVSIVRAVLQMPDILLLDEPTAHLDDNTAQTILNILHEYLKYGMIIMVTHDEDLCKYANIVLKIEQSNCYFIKNNPIPSSNDFVKSKHYFKKRNLFLKDLKYNRFFYLETIFSISFCIVISLLSLNIGQHFSNEVANIIGSSYESKQMTVTLPTSIDEQHLDNLINKYDIYQVNYNYELIDVSGQIIINSKKFNVEFDENNQILKPNSNFAISSKLADDLNIKLYDTVQIQFSVIDGIESKKGYRFNGKYSINKPIFVNHEFNWMIDDIIQNDKPIIYLTGNALKEIKSKSKMSSELKTDSFTLAFSSKEEYEKAKSDFNTLGFKISNIETLLAQTRNELLGQFLPFRYSSILLGVILLITFLIVIKSIKANHVDQYNKLKQINVSTKDIVHTIALRNTLLFAFIFILSTILYLIIGLYINHQFDPLHYSSIHYSIKHLVENYKFTMISFNDFSFLLQILFIDLTLSFIFSIADIFHLINLHKEIKHNNYN